MKKVERAGWFSPRTLMDHCTNLGMVVDLTNTTRYYDSNEFSNQGIQHAKIFTEGKVVPNQKVVNKFFIVVNNFLKENTDNEKLIGVHCTHGLNRSGYMICRYMIQQLGIPSDQAIADYNSARGHEQERENYLTDLRQAPWINDVVPTSDDDDKNTEATTPNTSRNARRPYFYDSANNKEKVKVKEQYCPRALTTPSSGQGKSSFKGVYDSGAFAGLKKTVMVTQTVAPGLRHQLEGGVSLRDNAGAETGGRHGGVPRQNQVPAAPRDTKHATRHASRQMGHGGTTTRVTTGGWHHSTTPTSTNNGDQALAPTEQHHGGLAKTSTNKQPRAGPGSTEARDHTVHPLHMKNHHKLKNSSQRHQREIKSTRHSQGRPTGHQKDQKDPSDTLLVQVPKTTFSALSRPSVALQGGTLTDRDAC
ncbi:uncharacterized protein LOC121855077 isoform X1 [Homarus americanus]|uniref:uncharacterized protein LOC121855077 isoform X1 n=1 Tax=Homarus americanus TaxID=6706 RepID=UPI001C46DC68|nr:uncharacterized protein LOC121855077 isoform X1 [Homarus americanus]